MWDKKGDLALPAYFSIALAALVIILFIFAILFFVVGVPKNPNLVIKSASYQDSSKLMIILKTEASQVSDTKISELLSLANKDESYKDQLSKDISFLLDKLPKPKEDSQWILNIKINNSAFLNVGEENPLGVNYLKQNIVVPLENKDLAFVELYLNCLLCKEEDIDNVA